LNGASTEGLGSQVEQGLGLFLGIMMAFIFEWRTALVALGISPPLLITNIIFAKLAQGMTENEDKQTKEANAMISDSIINQKTIASFGNQHLIVEHVSNLLEKK
jgi:ATP-binding cassette subfamily B (MDR/TAP) protein 1